MKITTSIRKRFRVSNKLKKVAPKDRLRLCITRSARNISAQIIDDSKKAQDKKITKIFFDRGIYKYHGRIKVFADTLRKNGMDF